LRSSILSRTVHLNVVRQINFVYWRPARLRAAERQKIVGGEGFMIVRPRITSDQATPFCDRTPRPAAPGQRDAIRGAGTSSKNQFRRPRRVPKVLDLAMKLSFTHQVSGTRGSRVQISPLRPGINNKSSHLASSADFGIRRNNGNESGISHRQAAGSRTPPTMCRKGKLR
jgi:hypothetical protein